MDRAPSESLPSGECAPRWFFSVSPGRTFASVAHRWYFQGDTRSRPKDGSIFFGTAKQCPTKMSNNVSVSIFKYHVSCLRAPSTLLPFAAVAVYSAFGLLGFDSQLPAKHIILSLILSSSLALSVSLHIRRHALLKCLRHIGLVSSQRLPRDSLCTSPS